MGKYEDLLERVSELEGGDDIASELEEFSATSLRRKAAKADELESKVADLEADIAKRDAAPKIEKAFREAGVQFDQLRPADRQVLQGLDPADLTSDKVAEVISSYELPIDAASQAAAEDPPPAAAVVAAARQAPASTSTAATAQITPEDAGSWPIDTQLRFKKAHPDEFEALKRGDTVTGILFQP